MRKRAVVLTTLLASTLTFANGPKKSTIAVNDDSNGMVKNIIAVDLDPTFVRKGDKLYVNLLNLDLEKVVIKVYDSQKRLVFKEVLKGDLVIEKAFNFESAYSDDYTVVIIDNEKAFKEKVAVE